MLTPHHKVTMLQQRWLLLLICIFNLGLMHPGMVNAAVDLGALTPVDNATVAIQVSYRSFNRRSGAMTYTVTLNNVSTGAVQGPLYLAIESITAGGVTVTNADEPSALGAPLLHIETLAPGESRSRSIVFSNPGRARFRFTTVLYGAVSQDDTPPLIAAAVSPAANPAGWHNTDVIVSFDCSDTDSGIASCTTPVTVTTEGAAQIVNGTAQDNVGNTANASATLNIDKTPPVITIDAPEEGASLGSDAVTVSGSSSDSLSGITALTCNGAPATRTNSSFSCDLSLPDGDQSIIVVVTDAAGNTATSTVTVVVNDIPVVQITAPATLSLFNSSPVTVSGSIDDDTATVSVNGTPATVTGGSFEATVPISEGNNVLTAVATNPAGNVGTASIQVTLDTTPPVVTIGSPVDGTATTDTSVTVTGMINDIVVGTVNGDQAQVTVNGLPAQVANRSFLVADVPLSSGVNIITAAGVDQAGNTASASIVVTSEVITDQARIERVSGNNQTAPIGVELAEPIVVRLTDENGGPVPNKNVIFKVVQNNGTLNAGAPNARSVVVVSDAQGQAQANWILGMHAGAGNNQVEATAVRFAGVVSFTATALTGVPAKINVDAGNHQVGQVGQRLPLPIVAIVTDAGHNRLVGVPVTFLSFDGESNFDGLSSVIVTTNSDGRAQALLTLSLQEGINNNRANANYSGNTDAPASFVASGTVAGDPAKTKVTGLVLDNTDQAVPGVTLLIPGANLSTQSDDRGYFVLQPAPVGHIELVADGSTTSRPGAWPTLEYELVTVAGHDNTLGMPIYLLPLDLQSALLVDNTNGGTLILPELPGFSLTVKPGSATFPDGTTSGVVSVTPVHSDKVPMTPNFGLQPRFIVTIQPAGTLFEPPAPISIPNVDGLQPGEITELYSFDLDLGQFVGIGTGTVTEDGAVIQSDPGVGIIKGGWHASGSPAPTGCSYGCPQCTKPDPMCNCVPIQDGQPCDDKNACTLADSCFSGFCSGEAFAGHISAGGGGVFEDRWRKLLDQCKTSSALADICTDEDMLFVEVKLRPNSLFSTNNDPNNVILNVFDQFKSKNVDLDDLEALDREKCSWSADSCQLITHFLSERLREIKILRDMAARGVDITMLTDQQQRDVFDESHLEGIFEENTYRGNDLQLPDAGPGEGAEKVDCIFNATPFGGGVVMRCTYRDGRYADYTFNNVGALQNVYCSIELELPLP